MTITHEIGPFAIVPLWVFDALIETKQYEASRLYIVLHRWTSGEDRSCYPSRKTIAEACGVSTDTIDRYVKALEAIGALHVEARRDAGGCTSNRYTLLVSRTGAASRTDAAEGTGTDAAGGSRVDAAENQTHLEPDPVEPDEHSGRSAPRTPCRVDPQRTSRDQALSVACPRCQSVVGAACIGVRNAVRESCHRERHQALDAHGPPPAGSIVDHPTLTDAFEAFWETYEHTGPRKKAWECWRRAVKKESPDVILRGLERWMAYWHSPGATRIKWPQGWLGAETWRDDPPSIQVTAPRQVANPYVAIFREARA